MLLIIHLEFGGDKPGLDICLFILFIHKNNFYLKTTYLFTKYIMEINNIINNIREKKHMNIETHHYAAFLCKKGR